MTENRFASETLFFNKPAFSLFSLPPPPSFRNVVLSAQRLIFLSLPLPFIFVVSFYFISFLLFFLILEVRSIRSAFIKRENVNVRGEKRV